MAQRILLVDDDEVFRYACARTIAAAGFDVEEAPDYRKALTILEDKRPLDLLITDVVMPDRINGFALARMARMRHLDLKVLYVTAYDIPTTEAVGKIVRKPINDDELLTEIHLALGSSRVN